MDTEFHSYILSRTHICFAYALDGTRPLQTETLVQRQRHVLREMLFLGVSTRFIEGTTYDDGSWGHHNLMKLNLFMTLEACATAPTMFDFCLIFQDDTKFHGEFWKHAATLINGLPNNWTAVHLCPGPLSPVLPDLPEEKWNKTYKGPPVTGRDPRLFTMQKDQMTVTLANDNGTR